MAVNKKPPAPTRDHHDQFCENEGWTLVRGATGRPVQHHRTYELLLWDSRILRTRISKPVDKTTYGPKMWSQILREQLQVTATVFWGCVIGGKRPDRGRPEQRVQKNAMPLHLFRALSQFGLAEDAILELDAAGAAELLSSLYASGKLPSA